MKTKLTKSKIKKVSYGDFIVNLRKYNIEPELAKIKPVIHLRGNKYLYEIDRMKGLFELNNIDKKSNIIIFKLLK